MAVNVAVLVGSLRRASYSRKIAFELMRVALGDMRMSIVDIGDLPHYNQDDEDHPPESWTRFRASVMATDAVLFVTPEYNRSIPGVLKNAIDVGSRPMSKNVWAGKPAAVLSSSPGALGGFGANHHLRQCLVAVGMPTLAQPEMYLGRIANQLDSEGHFADAATYAFLAEFVFAFGRWIKTLRLPAGS